MKITKYTGRLPWWMRPWGAFISLRRSHMHELAVGEARTRLLHYAESEVSRLQAEVSRLSLGAGSGMPSTGEPDFVLVGVQRPPGMGVRVIASRKLAGAMFDMTSMEDPPPRWVIRATMAQALFVDKPSYPEAIAHIGTIWANWDHGRETRTDPPPGKPWSQPGADVKGDIRAAMRKHEIDAQLPQAIDPPKEDENAADQGN
jgi:hypothetical protein